MRAPIAPLALAFAAALAFSCPPALAQDKAASPPPAATPDANAPDTSKIMFIENLRRIGATIYYMGEALGLNSWLAVKDKQLQILYTTPDQRAVLMGALLSAEGANISQQQMMALAARHPQVAAVLREGQGATVQIADDKEVPLAPDAPPSEQLYADLARATHVTFGKPEAPLVYMVMDVHCRHCVEAWKAFEPHIDAGRVRLAMIPVNALGAQSEVDAANWLNTKDPRDAWKKHVAGDKNVLKIGDADPDKENKVYANTLLIARWKIDKTPYFFYRGANGKVRLVAGKPQDVAALLDDLN